MPDITWTEIFDSFTVGTGSAWTNYDIYTNKSIPKGAIVVICCAHATTASAVTIGVRADGSSLNRYIKLHEAEAGGYVTCTMLVKVDSSTGYIEYYTTDTSTSVFYILGYFENIDFTEKWSTITGTTDYGFEAKDIYTSDGVPKGSVCHIILGNRRDGNSADTGVRTYGSAINRMVALHEAESASAETTDHQCASMFVKSDTTYGRIEVLCQVCSEGTIILGGYFALTGGITYTECAVTAGTISSADTWTDWDLSGTITSSVTLADILTMHSTTGTEEDLGCRKKGSSLSRQIVEHEAETNGKAGMQMPTAPDSSKYVQILCGSSTTEYMVLVGWLNWTVTAPVGRSFGVIIA